MSYTPMLTLSTASLVTVEEWNKIKDNFDFLANLKTGGIALKNIAAEGAIGALVGYGQYVGDGAGTAASSVGQVIGGLSFSPDVVIIATRDMGSVTTAQTELYTRASTQIGAGSRGCVVAFGANSFTVSDGGTDAFPNKTGVNYVFVRIQVGA